MSRYLGASVDSCIGVATSWKFSCKWCQACRNPDAILWSDPSLSVVGIVFHGDGSLELNEFSPR